MCSSLRLVLLVAVAACKPPSHVPALKIKVSVAGDKIDVDVASEPGAQVGFAGGRGRLMGGNGQPVDAQGHAVLHAELGDIVGDSTRVWAQLGKEATAVPLRMPPLLRSTAEGAECFGIVPKCSVTVWSDKVSVRNAEKGAHAIADGHDVSDNGRGDIDLPIDLWPLAAKLPAGELVGQHNNDAMPVGLPLAVRYASAEMRGEARVRREALQIAYDKHYATEGPVDAALAPAGNGLVIAGLDLVHGGAQVLGEVKSPADVRWLARIKMIPRSAGSCGTYKSDKGARTEMVRSATDVKVSIVERQTGAALAEQTLRGPTPPCSMFKFGAGGAFVADAPLKSARAWVDGWYAKHVNSR